MIRRILAWGVAASVLALGSPSAADSQEYAVGAKVEAYVYYSWQKATVVRVILNSQYSNYEVVVERADGRTGAGISNFQVSRDNVRPYRESERLAPRAARRGEGPRLGDYSIYSYGATSTTPLYIGHVRLEQGGAYRVSRASSGQYFGGGRYSFDAATSTVRWLNGPFKNNGWGGKFEIVSGGKGHRLTLTERTIGTNYDEN